MLWQPAGDDVANPVTDVHGVVTDAFIEPGNNRKLHGHLEVDAPGIVTLKDHLDELDLQAVKHVIHVVKGGGYSHIALGIGVDRQCKQVLGLLGHAADDPTNLRVERVTVDAA